MAKIQLLVGLGNPGQEYAATRHNAGAWLVEALAASCQTPLAASKFFGLHAQVFLGTSKLHLLIPTTFMNRSGQAIAALANFYKIPTEDILVAHDELDLPPGVARLKKGGGHGGHNGLRSTISSLGNNKDFYRLRLGIGHPGQASKVTGYVLGKPSSSEQLCISAAIEESLRHLELIVKGEHTQAMNRLHSFKAE